MTRREPEEQFEEIGVILSHDLKNPLAVARGNLELARETGDEEFFENASGALDRIEELVDEVVYLARTGELIDEMERVELRGRAEHAWGNIRTEDAKLEVVSSSRFVANDRSLCHLLENLIENAIIHAGSDVTVRVGELDDGFFVEDDGPGIPEEHRSRILERGHSVESESSGLGLHIVNLITEAHGWELTVESSSEDGARFEIRGVELA